MTWNRKNNVNKDEISLDFVLKNMYEIGLNGGIEVFKDAGFYVWVGDKLNGVKAEKLFTDLTDVKKWFLMKAVELVCEEANQQKNSEER